MNGTKTPSGSPAGGGRGWDAVDVLVPRRVRDRLAAASAELRAEMATEVGALPSSAERVGGPAAVPSPQWWDDGGAPPPAADPREVRSWVSAVVAGLPTRGDGEAAPTPPRTPPGGSRDHA